MFLIKRGAIEGRLDVVYNATLLQDDLKSIYPTQKLKILVNTYSGGTPSKSHPEYWDGDICWVSPKDFNGNEIFDSEDKITIKGVENSAGKLVDVGSILMVVRSGVLQHTLPVAINQIAVTVNQDIKVIEVKDKSRLIPYYLLVYFKVFQNDLLPLLVKHGTTVQSVNSEQFEQLKIPIPPIEIQEKIVEKFRNTHQSKSDNQTDADNVLSDIDTYFLAQLGITKATAETDMQSRMFYTNACVTSGNRLDPIYHKKEFLDLEKSLLNGTYPVQNLGSFIQNISYGASLKNDYVDSGIPFLRITDVFPNEVNIRKLVYLPESSRKDIGTAFIQKDDFVITRSGTIGTVVLASEAIQGFAFGSFMIKFNIHRNAPIDKAYLQYFLNSEICNKIINREKIGAIQGNITIPSIKSIPIPLPPLSIQREIAQTIGEMRAKAKFLQQSAIDLVEQTKQEIEGMIIG